MRTVREASKAKKARIMPVLDFSLPYLSESLSLCLSLTHTVPAMLHLSAHVLLDNL
jgi:hypothetical protein